MEIISMEITMIKNFLALAFLGVASCALSLSTVYGMEKLDKSSELEKAYDKYFKFAKQDNTKIFQQIPKFVEDFLKEFGPILSESIVNHLKDISSKFGSLKKLEDGDDNDIELMEAFTKVKEELASLKRNTKNVKSHEIPKKNNKAEKKQENQETKSFANIMDGVNQHLDQQLKKSSYVFCPLGIGQTLAGSKHIVTSENIQKEFKQNADGLNRSLTPLNQELAKIKNEKDKVMFSNNFYVYVDADKIGSIPEKTMNSFQNLGGTVSRLKFSDTKQALKTINEQVSKDTHGKIPKLLESVDKDTVLALLHTLYVNVKWAEGMNFKSDSDWFEDHQGENHNVAFFENKKIILKYLIVDGSHYVRIPTAGDFEIIIRYNPKDVAMISPDEISTFQEKAKNTELDFKVPFVKMTQSLDLQNNLKELFPQFLTGKFASEPLGIDDEQLKVGQYLQKVTFDMTDKGIEASAATFLGFTLESATIFQNPQIHITGPFSFVFGKTVEVNGKKEFVTLFQGQVIDDTALVKEMKSSEEE